MDRDKDQWHGCMKLGFFAIAFHLSSCWAAQNDVGFGNLSLEELGNIEITSVSKRAERLSDAAASIFIITNDDIRRSGATSLPEALRLAPNLQIARVSSSSYAITARGFNGSGNSAPNKLLVLIDGRSVYSPLFAGVFWDVQDVMLEDVERIEVISGPGGTLWGVNAVNGVINVITRAAGNTQGNLVTAGAGNEESTAAFRHGGTLGNEGSYRVYGKYSDKGHTSTDNNTAVRDAWHTGQVGFRADWEHAVNQFTLQANMYKGNEEQPEPGAIQISGVPFALGYIPISGVNLLTRWNHVLDSGSTLNLQAYYDRTERTVSPVFDQKQDIVDLQLEHSMHQMGRHSVAWGASYRTSADHIDNTTPYFAFLPATVHQAWSSLFAQDEITLPHDLKLTLGSRIEWNDYTCKEFLPNVRVAWKPGQGRLLWGAISRTVRAPSRLDRDAFIPARPPFLLNGGAGVVSEVAKVYEIGYRSQPTARVSYSITAFHTVYDHLRTQEVAPSQSFLFFANEMEGTATGIEMWGSWQASEIWRLSAGLTALKERLHLQPGSTDMVSLAAQGHDPAQSWMLRSSLDLPAQTELDVTVRHVAALSSFGVPAYTAVDFRYGWKIRPDMELSVTGKNLFGGGHAEYGAPLTRSSFDRSVFVNVSKRF